MAGEVDSIVRVRESLRGEVAAAAFIPERMTAT
jgi:hypothetical protein